MDTASATTTARIPRVDTHLAKFSQGSTVALTGLAFVFNQPVIVLLAAIIMTLAAVFPTTLNPYRLLYRGVVLPLGLLKPRVVEDDPAPHRFAQGVGAVFLIAATLAPLRMSAR